MTFKVIIQGNFWNIRRNSGLIFLRFFIFFFFFFVSLRIQIKIPNRSWLVNRATFRLNLATKGLCEIGPSWYILTDKRNATTKKQSCFIQAVISSNYVEIKQQKLLAVSCFEGISNCVQRYHQPGENQGRNLMSRMPCLSSNFQKTLIHWKTKKERDNHE